MCKVFYYDQEELEKAREVQRDAIKLNLVPPIVTSLEVTKLQRGEEIEKHIMKSNSFVGNFYQGLLFIIGAASSSSFPNPLPYNYEKGGTAQRLENGNLVQNQPLSALNPNNIVVGSGTTPDIWENYKMENQITTFTDGTVSQDEISYDNNSQTVTTKQSKILINLTNSTQQVSECGIFHPRSPSRILLIRDVFTPIQIAQYEGIKIQYIFEFVYP